MTLGAADTVLCSGTLRAGISFRERLAAARAGGSAVCRCGAATTRRRATRGCSDQDIRLLLADHGLSVAELDPAWWWLPGASDVRIPPELDEERIFGFGERELFGVADAVGARSLNAVDVFGGTWSLDEAAAAFAGLCDRAAEHGLLVHLEFLPWSWIPDLATAWEVVRAADRPNGGLMLDAWHYFRSGADGSLSVPSRARRSWASSCATRRRHRNPSRSTPRCTSGCCRATVSWRCRRCWPTSGATGATAPLGVEVFSDVLHALPPQEAGRLAGWRSEPSAARDRCLLVSDPRPPPEGRRPQRRTAEAPGRTDSLGAIDHGRWQDRRRHDR